MHALDIDKVAPENPVILQRTDTHLVWVNSLALKMAGIDVHTLDPIGGKIEKDVLGKPSGILIDLAILSVTNALPASTYLENKQMIQRTLQECLQKGLTSIHNAATDENDFEVFKQLATENALDVRLYSMMTIRGSLENKFLDAAPKSFGNFLQMRCLKFWMDGAMGSRGAALFEPYCDDLNNCGLLMWKKEDLLPLLSQAKSKGFQVAIHAIGDRASHDVLDMYEEIGTKGLRWRIEHAQQLSARDVKRFAEFGVIAGMQPLHATTDMVWLEKRLGKERVKSGAFLWRSLLKEGALITGGSDAPVVDFNPLWGMHAAITRQDHHQFPKKGWYPKERMTREQALKIYTLDAAYAGFSENNLGSLTAGKWADLVILPENLLTCSPDALLDMKVLYTIVNGKIVYKI